MGNEKKPLSKEQMDQLKKQSAVELKGEDGEKQSKQTPLSKKQMLLLKEQQK